MHRCVVRGSSILELSSKSKGGIVIFFLIEKLSVAVGFWLLLYVIDKKYITYKVFIEKISNKRTLMRIFPLGLHKIQF